MKNRFVCISASVSLLSLCAAASGAIDLEFRASAASVALGENVEVRLYAVSDDAETNQLFAAAQAIFTWDPAHLVLVSETSAGAIPLLLNDLPVAGDYGLNEADPPADGDGFLLLLANLGTPAVATPEGSLLHTFVFQAIAPTAGTLVDVAATGGSGGESVVYDGTVPGLEVTGQLIGASIEIVGVTCVADLDFDANVGFSDLVILLSAWGACDGCAPDFDGNGFVEFDDLLQLLAAWGPC